MRTSIWAAAAALLLATSAVAAEPKEDPNAPKSAAEIAREKMEQRRAASKSAARPSSRKQAEAANDQLAALRAKHVYMYAVEACDQAVRCDPVLRDDAEKSFMEACQVCASAERCETERDRIKGGTAKRVESPCPPKKK